MIKQTIIILGSLCLLSLQSCTTSVIEEVDKDDLTPIVKTIKYNSDVQTIMYNNCITCHGGSVPSAGLKLNNYADVKNSAKNGSLIERMNNDTSPMPPSGKLSVELRQIMDKWKTDGYLEN